MFISRLGQGVACAVAALSLGQLAAAQSVDTLVKSAFGHTFGLFGPLPFSAKDAVASGSTVSLIDAHYGAIPLGDVRLSVQPLGDSVFQVTGRDMPQNYSDASGASVRAARWTLAGEWNAVIGGYQKLDYRINDLRMQDASGGRTSFSIPSNSTFCSAVRMPCHMHQSSSHSSLMRRCLRSSSWRA